MPTYQWAGLELAADFALPELVPLERSRAAFVRSPPERHWSIRRWRGRTRTTGTAIRWFHHWTFPNGRRWLSFARLDDGYLLRFFQDLGAKKARQA